MNKNNRLIRLIILLYISVIFFNGIITKITLPLGILSIKKILPEILLAILMVLLGINILKNKKIKVNLIFLGMIFYIFSFTYQLLDMNDGNLLYSIRDNLLPFILLFFIYNNEFDDINKGLIVKRLKILFKIFIISGIILGILQNMLGWQWTSEFFTGKVYYGRDEITGINIWEIGSVLRVPSVTGDSVIFAICNFFVLFLFDIFREKRIYKIIIFLNIVLSTSRTILLLALIYEFINFITRSNKINKELFSKRVYLSLTMISCVLVFVIGIFYLNMQSDFFGSLYERINGVWNEIFIDITAKELFLGKGVFKVGSGMSTILAQNLDYQYKYSFVDNTYIYITLCYGILGLLYFCGINMSLLRKAVKYKNYNYISFIVSSIIGAFSINYMQGRSFIYLYVLSVMFIKYSKESI